MGGDSPYFWSPVFLCVGLAAGRWLASRPELPAIVVLAISVTLISLVTSGAGAAAAPLGYANANAALGIQLAVVAGLVAVRRTGPARLALALAALGALTIPVFSASKAGVTVSLIVVLAGAVAASRRAMPKGLPLSLGPLSVAVAAGAVAWAASIARLPDIAELAVDPVRHRLWRDAFTLWQQSPIGGSGPGSFARFSPLAADPDTSTAHSSVLQVAAETGVIGVGLFALLVALGFVFAGKSTRHGTWLAVAAWTALAIHSFSDHLLEFPAVVFTAGVVLGLAGRLRTAPNLPG
ncbi:O-antigen ligase family protein [Ammonicoccus fulvus]|uniref:O-antigen ligase family protein n=1 Tax=Ammonicoccus fulvus TaxID=3138240 RepID=A0ABZ3FP12_9ACTN